MCSKGVAQGVGANLLVDTRQQSRLLNDIKDHNAREGLTSVVQKERRLRAMLRLAMLHIELYLVACSRAYGH